MKKALRLVRVAYILEKYLRKLANAKRNYLNLIF